MPSNDANQAGLPAESTPASTNENSFTIGPDFNKILHDLRTPVTAILGLAEIMKLLLEAETFNKEELGWYVKEIEQEALRMREFLGYSQF